MTRLPLEGIRILDMAQAWAGGQCTKLLADMGAQNIKIESLRRTDPVRGPAKPPPGFGLYPNNDPGERPWNRAGSFNERHRNKFSLTLDLTTPQGKELLKALVLVSDVVVENFSARVLKNLGLNYEVLAQVNPTIILLSMYGIGSTGPEKDYVTFGPTIEELSGATSVTGYEDGPPQSSGIYYTDPATGIMGVGALLAALQYRRRTGKGMHLELSQLEANSRFIGDLLVDYSMNGRVQPRVGNRHPSAAPHNAYRCRDEDSWIAIEVHSDQEWAALSEAMSQPDLAGDPRFADAISRYRNQKELDGIVEEWTSQRDHLEATRQLQAAGVRSGAVLSAAELLSDPHLSSRGFYESVTHPEAGPLVLPGMHFKLSKTPGSIRTPAPTLGQHNDYFLGDLLSLSREEIAELEEQGIIGTIPSEAR